MNDQDGRPRSLQRKELIECVPRFWIIDGSVSMKWRIFCASVFVLLMESSKTNVGFIKFVQMDSETTYRTALGQKFGNPLKAY
jgi:hypothetical protein